MNYISTVVKILEEPTTVVKILKEPNRTESETSILVTEVRAQASQVRSKDSPDLVTLVFWGNLGQVVWEYYRPNDYLLIEGYISIKNKKFLSPDPPTLKYIEILVFKVYPFCLKSV